MNLSKLTPEDLNVLQTMIFNTVQECQKLVDTLPPGKNLDRAKVNLEKAKVLAFRVQQGHANVPTPSMVDLEHALRSESPAAIRDQVLARMGRK